MLDHGSRQEPPKYRTSLVGVSRLHVRYSNYYSDYVCPPISPAPEYGNPADPSRRLPAGLFFLGVFFHVTFTNSGT